MKYLKIMFKMTEGYRKKYIAIFVLQFFNVLFMQLAPFIAMILVNVLTDSAPIGSVSIYITNLLGGNNYLKKNLWILALITIGVALCGAITNIIRHRIRADIDTGIGKKDQLKIFNYLERLDYAYLKNQKSGDIIQIATRDEEILRRFVIGEFYMIGYTFNLIIISFLLLLDISWQLALSAIIILPILAVYSFFVVKVVRRRYLLADESEAKMTGMIEENIRGTRTVKAFNNEHYEIERFENHIKDYEKKTISSESINNIYIGSSDILVFGQITFTTLFGIYLTYTQTINIGALFLGITFVNSIVWPVRQVASILSNLAKAIASMERMNILFNAPLEDLDSGDKPIITGQISFNNMGFKYADGDEVVLNQITFDVEAGQTIAIMGKTGSGKSTLAHLLTRLYDYTSGSVTLNGHELININKKHLRKNVAIVLQEPFLFSKTIINNLKIANVEASDEEIFKAARVAHIHDSIVNFKDGYETKVGEQGVTLSGGQKQRLVIARTLISEAPILLFDDSLSAVDTQTDMEIREALRLRALDKKTTTMIITHRVATAQDADKIIVLENGTIKQYGKHDELIKEDGLYKRIFEIQTRIE